MDTYSHGGDIKKFAKTLKCKTKNIIDLSSNINFIKPKIDLGFNNLDFSSYPAYDKIYQKIAKLYGIKTDQLELFNGGSSAIFSLFLHLDFKHSTIYSPAYLEYKKSSFLFGKKTTFINRYKNIYQDIAKNSFVIFVNPSTPDGKYYNMDRFFKIWKKADATVLIDESFLPFCGKKSTIDMIKKYKKLYILKSMTKIYSCAGVRVGAIISNKKNIKNLKQKQPLWRLSQFDISYLQNVIKDKKFIKKTVKKNKKNKKYLIKILKKSKLCKKIFKSDGNFLLIKLKNLTAKQFQKKLNRYKILVRDCSNFTFLDDTYVRIAIKEKYKLKVLKKALA
jgi:threonine-phosphate decarboxylase